jgi:hypothetical protein
MMLNYTFTTAATGTTPPTPGKYMTDFWHAIEWFVYGAIVGYFAHPIWHLLTRIVEEAKLAKDEWRNPK